MRTIVELPIDDFMHSDLWGSLLLLPLASQCKSWAPSNLPILGRRLLTFFIRADHIVMGEDVNSCWKEIAAETGFASYLNYLEAYEHESRFAQDVLQRKKIEDCTFGSEDLSRFSCAMIDLSKDVNSAINVSTNHYEGGNAAAADALKDIRQPPKSSCARVLLWFTEPKGNSARILPSWFLDVCGLGLRVGPEFFGAVADRFVLQRVIQFMY